jgi:hypothetical protein
MAENKSNKQYFERALSKSFGFGKSLIYQVLPALFYELHRLLRGTIANFVVAVVSTLEYIYPRPAS